MGKRGLGGAGGGAQEGRRRDRCGRGGGAETGQKAGPAMAGGGAREGGVVGEGVRRGRDGRRGQGRWEAGPPAARRAPLMVRVSRAAVSALLNRRQERAQ